MAKSKGEQPEGTISPGAPLPPADWITVDELAAHLRIPRTTAYDFVHRHKLPFIKIGKHIRIQKDVVVQLLSELAAGAGQDKGAQASNRESVPSGPA